MAEIVFCFSFVIRRKSCIFATIIESFLSKSRLATNFEIITSHLFIGLSLTRYDKMLLQKISIEALHILFFILLYVV